MKNLLKCEYARLFRSTFIWKAIYALLMFLVIFFLGDYWIYTDLPLSVRETYNNDGSLFANLMPLMIVIPIFISSFIGTEFSDGTIRNKLVSGKTHFQIYITDYIVSFSLAAVLNVLLLVLEYIFGGIFFEGAREITFEKIGTFLLYSTVFLAAYTAIFVIIPLLVQKKSTANTLCGLGCFLMYLSPSIFELLRSYKKIFDKLYIYLPNCCLYRVSHLSDEKMMAAMICSFAIVFGLIFIGVFTFRKENIK